MGSKTISLDDDAYAKLKAAKRPGESFSQVVHRLLADERPSLLDFVGVMTPEAAEEVRETMEMMRRFDLDAEERRLRALERED